MITSNNSKSQCWSTYGYLSDFGRSRFGHRSFSNSWSRVLNWSWLSYDFWSRNFS